MIVIGKTYIVSIDYYKEVIQPQVPLRLPCLSSREMFLVIPCLNIVILPISILYDLAHLAELWLDSGKNQKLTKIPLGWLDGQCVQGAGTYSPLESTHPFRFSVHAFE